MNDGEKMFEENYFLQSLPNIYLCQDTNQIIDGWDFDSCQDIHLNISLLEGKVFLSRENGDNSLPLALLLPSIRFSKPSAP